LDTWRTIRMRPWKRGAIGIAVDDEQLTVAACTRARQGTTLVFLEKVGSAQGVAPLMAQSGLKPTRVFCSISQAEIAMKFVTLPSRDPQEIADMLRYEVPKHLPGAPNQIIYSWQALPAQEEGYSQISLMFTRRETLERAIGPLRSAKLSPHEILPESWALCSWLTHEYPRLAEGRWTILWPNASSQLVMLISDGQVGFARSSRFRPGQAQAVIDETVKSLELMERDLARTPPPEVMLAGDLRTVEQWEELLRDRLSMETARLHDQMPEPVNRPDDATLPERSEAVAEGLALAAIEASPLRSTLTPPLVRARQAKIRRLKETAVIVGYAVGILLLLVGLMKADKYRLQKQKAFLLSNVARLKPAASRVESKRKRLQLLKQELQSGVPALEVLTGLARIMPEGITLSSMTFQGNGELELRGQANEISSVLYYIGELEASPHFSEVDLRNTRRRALGESELTDFHVTCRWTKR